MKRAVSISLKAIALLTILSFFTSGCSLVDDILRALGRLCATPVFEVTTTADIASGLCTPSGCSLRQAVITSNACPGTQSIHIPAGTYALTLTGAGEDAARSGDLDITDNVSFSGDGSPVIDGNHTDRVFDVFPGATVDISGLIIQHGQSDDGGGIRNRGILRIHSSTIQNNVATAPSVPSPTASGSGGGILSEDDGTLTLDNSQVVNNTALAGGGIAVFANSTTSTLFEMVDTNVTGNTATQSGGGLWLDNQVHATLTRFDVSHNTASTSDGDGIWNAATLTLTTGTIGNNVGGINGGGINNEPAGTINATEVLLQSNMARFGGGIYNQGTANFIRSAIVSNRAERGQGGGIYNSSSDPEPAAMTLDNTTIALNTGDLGGGGIRNDNTALQISYSTIAVNTPDGINGSGAAAMTMRDSIIAGHSSGDCTGTPPVSAGFNIDKANTCGFGGPGDMPNTDPILGAMGMYGGTTPTLPLNPGSPAIDSADPASCDPTDQRGVPRPQGLRCDRGAYELQTNGGAPVPPTFTPTPTPTSILTATDTPAGMPSLTPTATPILVVITPPGTTFGSPLLSTDHFYSGGGGCGVLDLKIQIGVSGPDPISSVVLFFRLEDKAGTGSTDWNDGIAMQPLGGGQFSYDLASNAISKFNSYPEAWLVYQFAAAGPGGKVLLRSPVFKDVTLSMCGQK